MKAAVITSYGPPEVMRIRDDIALPQAGRGEVRVKVKTAGVQPFDCAVRGHGWTPPGMSVTFPQILGNEFAGVVEQVGEDVTDVNVGHEVIGWAPLASYAEYVAVPVNQIVRKPWDMDWEEAGVITASGQTAYTVLQELNAAKGECVLIHAAAGGVGTFAVQMARAKGCSVIGTASRKNHQYLQALGAVPVEYGPGLTERVQILAPEGVDVVVDAAGGEAPEISVNLVKDKSRIGTIVAFDKVIELGIQGIRGRRSVNQLQKILDLYKNGKLKIKVRKSFPLEQAAEAHHEVESGHGCGKIVLRIE